MVAATRTPTGTSDNPIVEEVYAVWGVFSEGIADYKFVLEDLGESPRLQLLAEEFVDGYEGEFEFVLDMQDGLDEYGGLTPKQAVGVLNVMVNEAKQARGIGGPGGGQSVTTLPELGFFYVPVGDAIVPLRTRDWEEKGLRTIQGYCLPGSAYPWENVAYIDPEKMTMNVGRKHKANPVAVAAVDLLASAAPEQLEAFGVAYAEGTNKCRKCGRRLKVPTSMFRGYGPDCFEQVGGQLASAGSAPTPRRRRQPETDPGEPPF